MSKRGPWNDEIEPPGVIDTIFSKVQKVDLDLVERLLRLLGNDLDNLQSQLERANRVTCRKFWRKWVEMGDKTAWPLVDRSWRRLDPITRWKLLDRALHDGLEEQAIGSKSDTISLDLEHEKQASWLPVVLSRHVNIYLISYPHEQLCSNQPANMPERSSVFLGPVAQR